MKNAKPMKGQVWASDSKTEVKIESYNEKTGNVYYSHPRFDYSLAAHIGNFHISYEFQPQNDLEWLAVNEPDWFHTDCRYIRRDGSRAKYCDAFGYSKFTYYTREQWQNMRYDLGLDERPYVEYETDEAKIREMMNDRGTMTFTPIKETKMIDLSTAKVGDQFVLNNGKVVSFFARTKMNSICEVEGGYAMLYEHDGKFDEGVERGEASESWRIVSKHEPRHWLKDFPDADLFIGTWMACDKDGVWFTYNSNPHPHNGEWKALGGNYSLRGVKMPTLTGDEWKLSKISIVELRAWQEQNR